MYKWQKIKTLRQQGKSIREIAKLLKLSKNTVNKYVNLQGPPEFKVRDYKADIMKYENNIQEMLKKEFIGTRIHEELVKLGYTRSLSSLYRYLDKLDLSDKQLELSTSRFESIEGRQMQYDWKHWTLLVKGERVKIYLHQLILGFSRKKFCTFSLTITTADIIRAIKEGIENFGALAPELLIDNPKQMVINHGDFIRYNDEFLRFCGLYGIEPSPCKPYRARTKGKVERPFYYIQEHFLRGLEVESLSEFSLKLKDFIEQYNNRPHSRLKEKPNERFWKEIDFLKEIPKTDLSGLFKMEARKVSNDGYVSFNGAMYPISMKHALTTVFCENISGFRVKIYDQKKELIVDNEISNSKERPVHPEHEEMNIQFLSKKQKGKRDLIEKFIGNFSDVGEKYCQGLKKEHTTNMYWHVSEIMAYLDFYSIESVKEALNKCLEIGSFHKNSVSRLLSVEGLKPIGLVNPAIKTEKMNITRSLSAYGGLYD
jgi:transposase